MKYGADNAVFAARIVWEKPNRGWNQRQVRASLLAGETGISRTKSACHFGEKVLC